MKLTTDHSQAINGIPVFVDDGILIDYIPAIKQVRKAQGWTVAQLADHCGVSWRTVQGWEMGRVPSKPALKLIGLLI